MNKRMPIDGGYIVLIPLLMQAINVAAAVKFMNGSIAEKMAALIYPQPSLELTCEVMFRISLAKSLYEAEETLDRSLCRIEKTEYSQAKSLLSTLFEDAVAAEAESDGPALSLI